MAFSKAYIRLAEIAERCRLNSSGMPAQQETVSTWSGVGFSMNGQRFVASLDEVAEVIPVPNYTTVPGAQGWMKGLANLRGRLLPVMDLIAFFNLTSSVNDRYRRLLVIDRGDLYSGLVVDEVWGMQHFPVDSHHQDVSASMDEVKPFVTGAYRKGDEDWLVFDVGELVEEPKFLQAAKIA